MTKGAGAIGRNEARPRLHEVKPRELTGRDVIARFQSQFRAAALACLRILEGKSLDRIYCDYQDDFVTRESLDGVPTYCFVQVKTKGAKKHQWSRLELFGLPLKLPAITKGALAPGGSATKPATPEQLAKIRGSFIGKLLEHAVNFGDSCGTVTLLTNVHLKDDVEKIAAAISIGDVSERTVRYLADNYISAFEIVEAPAMSSVYAGIGKLVLSAGHDYLDPIITISKPKLLKLYGNTARSTLLTQKVSNWSRSCWL